MIKHSRRILNLLTFVPIAVCVVCLFFLPDEIPMHFNSAGEMDRLGSKYELLIFPFFIIFMRLTMAGLTYVVSHGEGASEIGRSVLIYLSFCMLGILGVMTLYFLYVALAGITDLGEMPLDIYRLMCITMGIIFIPLGRYMPKLPRNSVSGLRTKWSMANDEAWRLSQCFGGMVFMVDGVITVLIGIFVKGVASMFSALAVLLAAAVIMAVYTRYACKRSLKDGE